MKGGGLTKPCADEESGDTLGVIVLLAFENLTSHSLLLQLRRQKKYSVKRLGLPRGADPMAPSSAP